MDAFLPFVAATFVATALAGLGYVLARRAGLGPVQAEYVRTLEGNNKALNERLDMVDGSLQKERVLRARLARHVQRLERTVVSLAEENDYLRQRLNMPRRRLPALSAEDIAPLTDPDYEPDDGDVEGHGEASA